MGCLEIPGGQFKSSKDYPEELRKLIVEDPEDGTRYIFLMNNLYVSAELNHCFIETDEVLDYSSNG